MKNFTISFYFYHLCQTLTDPSEKLSVDADKLWNNLDFFCQTSSLLPEGKNLRSYLNYDDKIKALKTTGESGWLTKTSSPIDFEKSEGAEDWRKEGNLLPFRLQDTYFADLTFSVQPSDMDLQPSELQQFPIDELLPDKINPSLGQTIGIYGETVTEDCDCQEIAEEYVGAVLENSKYTEPILLNSGNLFGSLLYEYEAAHREYPNKNAKKCHLLVLINNKEANTIELAQQSYEWLRDLLCCRHKILFVYRQSRETYLQGRKLYGELEKKIANFSKKVSTREGRLEYLKEFLKDLPQNYLDYTRCLRDLKAHQTAIETNTKNYQICLEKMAEIGEIPESWQAFLNRCELWQTQIKTDLDYLSPGQDLFDRVLNTARSMAQIDQAESVREAARRAFRSLERTVQMLGAGLGSGAIAASAIAGHVETPMTLKPGYPIHPAASTLFWSVFFGLIGWGIAWLCIGGWSSLKNK